MCLHRLRVPLSECKGEIEISHLPAAPVHELDYVDLSRVLDIPIEEEVAGVLSDTEDFNAQLLGCLGILLVRHKRP